MENRIQSLSLRYKEEKQHIGLLLTATTEEIENYERQISRLKIEANNALVTSQQKAQKAAVEYDSLTRKYTEQKEKLLNQVVTGLVQVFNFQQHVSSTLETLTAELSDQNKSIKFWMMLISLELKRSSVRSNAESSRAEGRSDLAPNQVLSECIRATTRHGIDRQMERVQLAQQHQRTIQRAHQQWEECFAAGAGSRYSNISNS